jgi:hypothetical protein
MLGLREVCEGGGNRGGGREERVRGEELDIYGECLYLKVITNFNFKFCLLYKNCFLPIPPPPLSRQHFVRSLLLRAGECVSVEWSGGGYRYLCHKVFDLWGGHGIVVFCDLDAYLHAYTRYTHAHIHSHTPIHTRTHT